MIIDLANGELFDSHCHLNSSEFDADIINVVASSKLAGVNAIIDVGVDIKSSIKAISNANSFREVYAAVGLDPQLAVPHSGEFSKEYYITEFVDAQIEQLSNLITQHKDQIVAIGETGIDNHYNALAVSQGKLSRQEAQESSKAQEYMFRQHLQLAIKHNLPLSVHSRAAEPRALAIAKEFPTTMGIFHSYTGDYQTAKQILDSGWGLGVNGIITFKGATQLREMYRSILGKVSHDWSPTDFYSKGIYFETDAPYLAPEGFRGQRNQPSYIPNIFAGMIKSLSS